MPFCIALTMKKMVNIAVRGGNRQKEQWRGGGRAVGRGWGKGEGRWAGSVKIQTKAVQLSSIDLGIIKLRYLESLLLYAAG